MSPLLAQPTGVYVHRLRKRYGEILREEIRQTVQADADVDGELRDLMAALSLWIVFTMCPVPDRDSQS